MTNISPFQGIALIDRNCTPEVIWYFPVEDLPEDVGERFNTLFKTREKWSLAEISPYVRYIFHIIFIISHYISYITTTIPPPPSHIWFIISHYISYITFQYISYIIPLTSGISSPLIYIPYKILYCINSVCSLHSPFI